MLGIGFALAVQSHLIRPEYFNHDFQLFPTWPRFDVELMMTLFWFSMVVLLVPKMLGLIRALCTSQNSPRRRRRHRYRGELLARSPSLGAVRARADAHAEPPCLRSIHGARLRLEAAAPRQRRHHLGRCVAFPQARHAALLRGHRGFLVSLALAPRLGVAGALGLFLAVPLSRASGSVVLGGRCRSRVVAHARGGAVPPWSCAARSCSRKARSCRRMDCRYLARNREARLAHIEGNLPRPVDPRGHPDPNAFTAEQKLHRRAFARRGAGVAHARGAGRSRRQTRECSISSRCCPNAASPCSI